MTNPFTAFTFATTGESASRTMPARLAEVHNVRDFGATGLGFPHDDLGAIMDAIDWTISNPGQAPALGADNRGTIYFPPGTYYVSAPIDFSPTASPQASGLFVAFRGEMGLSTIVGDFADYVLKRGFDSTSRWDGHWNIERLTVINRHAGGGGIRLGATQGSSIRDCDITADVAINDDNTDNFIDGGNVNGAFELLIESCNCRPYNTLATGSIGLYKCSDGPVTNCTFTGFDVGTCTASGQGGAAFLGCYWEGNNYGFFPGHGVEAWAGSGSNFVLEGGHFKNNGIAIYAGGGSGIYHGVYIEAATGSISGNPQYGIRVVSGGNGTFAGMSINGDFQQYGVSFVGGESIRKMQSCTAVGSVNSVSSPTKNWQLAEAKCSLLKNVNKAAVFTVSTLPAVLATITAASWRAGRVKSVTAMGGGSGYVNGSYSSVPLTGGTGTGATANIVVSGGTVVSAIINNIGSGYLVSDTLSASNTNLGGSGSGFTITGIVASGKLVGGSGYVDGNYDNVPLTGGSGSGATAKLSVFGGRVYNVSIEFSDRVVGSGYAVSDALSASNTHLGGSGSGFSISVASVENNVILTFSTAIDVSPMTEMDLYLTVAAMTPSGYNGAYVGWLISSNQLSYPLVSNPGTSSVMGTVFFTGAGGGTHNAFEGDTYNVSDANTATWGAAVTAGGGSNHVKVRYTPSAWTVVGK